MGKLYYTIEKELQSIDGFEETTGNKTVTVYEIANDTPKEFFTLELVNEDDSEEEIQDWLDANGFGTRKYEFIIL